MSCVVNGLFLVIYNFRIIVYFILFKVNLMVDVISRFRDFALSYALSDFFSGIRVRNGSCEVYFL